MAPREVSRPVDPADHDGLTNARIAAVLTEIADLLEIKGESSFKVGAYRRAADSVPRSGVEVAEAYQEVARRLGILPESGPRDLQGPKVMQ